VNVDDLFRPEEQWSETVSVSQGEDGDQGAAAGASTRSEERDRGMGLIRKHGRCSRLGSRLVTCSAHQRLVVVGAIPGEGARRGYGVAAVQRDRSETWERNHQT